MSCRTPILIFFFYILNHFNQLVKSFSTEDIFEKKISRTNICYPNTPGLCFDLRCTELESPIFSNSSPCLFSFSSLPFFLKTFRHPKDPNLSSPWAGIIPQSQPSPVIQNLEPKYKSKCPQNWVVEGTLKKHTEEVSTKGGVTPELEEHKEDGLVTEYSQKIVSQLISVIGTSLSHLKPEQNSIKHLLQTTFSKVFPRREGIHKITRINRVKICQSSHWTQRRRGGMERDQFFFRQRDILPLEDQKPKSDCGSSQGYGVLVFDRPKRAIEKGLSESEVHETNNNSDGQHASTDRKQTEYCETDSLKIGPLRKTLSLCTYPERMDTFVCPREQTSQEVTSVYCDSIEGKLLKTRIPLTENKENSHQALVLLNGSDSDSSDKDKHKTANCQLDSQIVPVIKRDVCNIGSPSLPVLTKTATPMSDVDSTCFEGKGNEGNHGHDYNANQSGVIKAVFPNQGSKLKKVDLCCSVALNLNAAGNMMEHGLAQGLTSTTFAIIPNALRQR